MDITQAYSVRIVDVWTTIHVSPVFVRCHLYTKDERPSIIKREVGLIPFLPLPVSSRTRVPNHRIFWWSWVEVKGNVTTLGIRVRLQIDCKTANRFSLNMYLTFQNKDKNKNILYMTLCHRKFKLFRGHYLYSWSAPKIWYIYLLFFYYIIVITVLPMFSSDLRFSSPCYSSP